MYEFKNYISKLYHVLIFFKYTLAPLVDGKFCFFERKNTLPMPRGGRVIPTGSTDD
jgi:hypothetical protein